MNSRNGVGVGGFLKMYPTPFVWGGYWRMVNKFGVFGVIHIIDSHIVFNRTLIMLTIKVRWERHFKVSAWFCKP